ncbi:DUF1549 domain-containing protein [bacterium]|nr:DUF1549 domain-containing protein [bacterium]
MPRLYISLGDQPTRVFELVGERITVGRAPANMICLDDESVSTYQAVLIREDRGYRLRDLNSTNCTHLNGIRISEARLRHADNLRFGSVAARFEAEPQPAPIPAAPPERAPAPPQPPLHRPAARWTDIALGTVGGLAVGILVWFAATRLIPPPPTITPRQSAPAVAADTPEHSLPTAPVAPALPAQPLADLPSPPRLANEQLASRVVETAMDGPAEPEPIAPPPDPVMMAPVDPTEPLATAPAPPPSTVPARATAPVAAPPEQPRPSPATAPSASRPPTPTTEDDPQVAAPSAPPPTTAELLARRTPTPYESQRVLVSQTRIDQLVLRRLQRLGIQPADVCSEAVFIRRVYLDVIGTLPTADEVRAFLDDRQLNKRSLLVDRLLEREEFADYLALRWSDRLRVKSEFPINLWPNAVQAYHRWIRTAVK